MIGRVKNTENMSLDKVDTMHRMRTRRRKVNFQHNIAESPRMEPYFLVIQESDSPQSREAPPWQRPQLGRAIPAHAPPPNLSSIANTR